MVTPDVEHLDYELQNPMQYDIISIGDSTHDTFVQVDEASVLCDIKPNQCLLCLSWADKIPAKKITQVPGVGNSANAAVSCARLGFYTGIYTHVGNDIVGQSILGVFKKENISRDFVKVEKGRPSNYSVVINYGAERTILVFHEKWDYSLPKNARTSWFYYSSLGPSHRLLHTQIIDAVITRGIKMAFQPGTHQLRERQKKLRDILLHSEILLLNKEEAQLLLETTITDPKHLLKGLHILGPHIAVMTDGERGAYAYDGNKTYFVNAFPPKAKERTGAGDSFSSAFVAAIMRGKSIEEALLWGNANATSVVQYVGAQAGLLDQKGIEKMIRKFRKVRPVVL